MKNKPRAFVDVETTGLLHGYHEIIEICILKEDGSIFHTKVHPTEPDRIDARAAAVNGYHPTGWKDAMEPNRAAAEIGSHLDGCVIIGHNPRFDYLFIKDLLDANHVKNWIDPRVIDTTTLAYVHLVPHGLRRLSLDEIRRFLGWKVRRYHNALSDTRDVQRLYNLLNNPVEKHFVLIRNHFRRWWGCDDRY